MTVEDVGLRVDREVDPAGAVLIRLDGELDLRSAPHLRAAMVEVFADHPPDGTPEVVIDLSGLSYADSAGLSMLVAAHKRADGGGGAVRLRSPSRSLRRLLEISGLDQLFVIDEAGEA